MYYLFAYNDCSPLGGMRDCVSKSKNLNELKTLGEKLLISKHPKDWVHIWEMDTEEILYGVFDSNTSKVSWCSNIFKSKWSRP